MGLMESNAALVHFWLYTCFVHLDSISQDNKNHPDDFICSIGIGRKRGKGSIISVIRRMSRVWYNALYNYHARKIITLDNTLDLFIILLLDLIQSKAEKGID